MLLEVKNLRKNYMSHDRSFSAVNNVQFSLRAGEFVTIMGKSGSGKTTLLNLIAGLLTPTAGEITLKQTQLLSLPDAEASAFRNRHIGYIPQGSSLLANLTVLENVRLPFYLAARTGASMPRALQLLKNMGIASLAAAYPAQLSGGESRRVAIARALMCQPEFIIADEPTSDLDEENAQQMMQLLQQTQQDGASVLVVTHDPDVARIGQRTLQMVSGKLLLNPEKR